MKSGMRISKGSKGIGKRKISKMMFILRLRYSAPGGLRFLHVDVVVELHPTLIYFALSGPLLNYSPHRHNTLTRPRKSLQLYQSFKAPTGRNTPASVYVQSYISIL